MARLTTATLLTSFTLCLFGCGDRAGQVERADGTTSLSEAGSTSASGSTQAVEPIGTPNPTAGVSPVIPQQAIPGLVQAEDYDVGVEGSTYHDTTPENLGGQYRQDGVDIEDTQDKGGGYDVGWIVAGEWLSYTVTIAAAGPYNVTARVASAKTGTKQLHLELDGVALGGGTFSFTSAAGWQSWTNATATVTLPQGTHELRIVMDSSSFNLNYLDFQAACTFSPIMESNCGALFGIYAVPPGVSDWLSRIDTREQQVGRTFDIVHAYHGWDQMESGSVPSSEEKSLINGGRLVLVNVTTRRFSNDTFLTWSQIANGAGDATITATAKAFAALAPHKIMLVFVGEPESKVGSYGTAADYVAAYKHFRQLFLDNGATNVIWVLDFTGYSGNYSTMMAMNPGSAYFDWYGIDPYDFHDTKGSFYNTVNPVVTWIDQNHQADGKPIMLPEYGVSEKAGDPAYKETWQANIASDLQNLPRVRAVLVFDDTGVTDTHIDTTATAMQGFIEASKDPYVNVLPH